MKEILTEWLTKILPWLLNHGIKIVIIAAATVVIYKLAKRSIRRIVHLAVKPDSHSSEEARIKREETLIRIFTWVTRIAVIIIGSMMILQEAGISVGPLIAGAGIIGLALGFGGQYLIRDVISGFFIILENQYRIGDYVKLDDTPGLVEDISLRITTIRDFDGTVHHIQHGNVKVVSNLSKDFARVNMDIRVAYNTELEHVINIINRVGNELSQDPQWKDLIIKPPQFLRIHEFSDSGLVIKIFGETQPLRQWEVSGELRKRLKIAFDKEGIEIPLPQRVVHKRE